MKQVIVTGSSTGIGYVIATELAKAGYRVIAGVRKDQDIERLNSLGLKTLNPVKLDVTHAADIDRLERDIEAEGHSLHAIVNNAGIVVAGPIEIIPMNEIRQQFDVNVLGLLHVTKVFAKHLRKTNGRIINISSTSGQFSVPFIGLYSASKFAVEALTDALRMELSPWGIKVSSVLPGPVKTPIWDKSEAVAFSILDKSSDFERALYERYLKNVQKEMEKRTSKAVEPMRVYEKVLHALEAKSPKTRYLVGPVAKVDKVLAKFIPDKMLDYFVGKTLFR